MPLVNLVTILVASVVSGDMYKGTFLGGAQEQMHLRKT